jgi:hypothetical protein
LVKTLKPIDAEQYCKENPDLIEYYPPSGYRRIPLSTCQGGTEFDKLDLPHPCPGHEKEFEKKYGISGAGLFFAITIPIAVSIAVGVWVYRQWRSGYGFGLGQIRLGEQSSTGFLSGESLWIAVPVAVVSGVVAVAKAIPLLVMSLWRSVSGYMPVGRGGDRGSGPYRSRDAFASRRQDYSRVVEDEDELLGEGDEGEEEV